jgi:Glycolipid 2-alpha-mannosyltransferase
MRNDAKIMWTSVAIIIAMTLCKASSVASSQENEVRRLVVTLATTLHDAYLFDVPMACAAWKHVVKADCMVYVVIEDLADRENDKLRAVEWALSRLGSASVRHVLAPRNLGPLVAQLSRAYAPMVIDDPLLDDIEHTAIVTSNVDIWPLSGERFTLPSEQTVRITNAMCCGTLKWQTHEFSHFPMHSMAARIADWQRAYQLHAEQRFQRHLSVDVLLQGSSNGGDRRNNRDPFAMNAYLQLLERDARQFFPKTNLLRHSKANSNPAWWYDQERASVAWGLWSEQSPKHQVDKVGAPKRLDRVPTWNVQANPAEFDDAHVPTNLHAANAWHDLGLPVYKRFMPADVIELIELFVAAWRGERSLSSLAAATTTVATSSASGDDTNAPDHRRRRTHERDYGGAPHVVQLVNDLTGQPSQPFECSHHCISGGDLKQRAIDFLGIGGGDDVGSLRLSWADGVDVALAPRRHHHGRRAATADSGAAGGGDDEPVRIFASGGPGKHVFVGDSLRVCMVMLITDDEKYVNEFMQNMPNLRASVMEAVDDPILNSMDVVILETWSRQSDDVAERWRRQVRDVLAQQSAGRWRGRVRFVDIASRMPRGTPKHHGTGCIGLNWPDNYLHMCQFQVSLIWHAVPELAEYDWWWRTDTDIQLEHPLRYNMFRAATHRNKTYAYVRREDGEPLGCSRGLKEATEDYRRTHDLQFQHLDTLLVTPRTVYLGAFGLFRTRFFLHDAHWLALTKHIDARGGVYTNRWGEQNMLPVALALLVPAEQMGWVPDYTMIHKANNRRLFSAVYAENKKNPFAKEIVDQLRIVV